MWLSLEKAYVGKQLCLVMSWEAVMLGYEFYKLTILDLHDYLNLD